MSAPPGAGSPFADRLDLLALLLAEEEDAAPFPEAPRIRPREPGAPAPLSFGQLRLWFLDRLDPGTSVYNVPLAWRLRGALDADALERALAETVRRHEALRTVFAPGAEEPLQAVLPEGGFALRREDLSASPAEPASRVREEAERPFDLSAGPLFRATLFRLAADEHVLLLVWHHAVSDGWSVDVVRAEAAALYGAFLRGEPSPLPPLPVQYADYALWQREHLGDEEVRRQLDWWRAQLDGAPPVLELATDRPRSAAREHRGARVAFAAGEGTLAGLAALAREESATSFMTTLAAFQLFLAKQAGMEDVVVGTPIASRPLPELEGLVGFFVNTLALRTDLSGDPTFRELLRRVRETVLGAFAHQDLPFERLVQELAPDRTLAHAPLVQAVFSQGGSSGGAPPPFAGLEATRERVWDPPAKFDLTMTVQELGGALRGELLYDADLFDAATAERMSERFVALLDRAAATPDARLSDFTLLTDAERRTVLEEWSRTGRDLPPATLHGAFAEQAARTPDAVALVFGGETVTYAELDRRSGELAGRLAALGVGPDARVGVCAERSPELVAAMLAVLKAGGAYVPLDPGYPAERLAWMLEDAGAPVLLAQEGLVGLFSGFGGEVVLLGEGGAGGAPEPTVPVTPDHLAYVIYTSGSTGRPKGTAVPHRAIPGFFREVEYARFDAGEVFLQHSSVSWDALTLELWPALLTGAKCVLLPARASEPELLAEQVRQHGVTTLWLSSAYFNLVVDTLPGALAGVRQVMVGGEAVSAAHVRRAREAHPGLRVVNGYGPSECTVFTTCWPVPAGFDGAVVPIGRPVGDRRVHLLDGDGAPVPAGVPGELHVSGPAVARGYLGRPALTAEKFVPDPFSGEAGARLYRTGDRARWRPDGTLEFLGRMDAQAKLRGFRVEPGEVEAALAEHPGVRECAVVVREDAPGEGALVAYVVPADGERTASAELRAWLRERLPDYLVPSAFAFLDALPLTPHGKLDRRALPAPETDAGAAYEPPATPTEEAVAAIFAEVLRVERVGARDHFFERGGHSLLATRAVSRVRESLGVELPLRALFEAPTPAELAARIDAEAGAGAGAGAPPLLPADRSAPLPLSFAQERMWVLQQIDPESRAYNVPVGLRLRGPLDAGALGRALAALVERHESLRTVFPVVEGAPVQAVAPFAGFALPVEELSALPETEREAEALRRAREASLRRYDLAEGPLFHAVLLRLGAADHLLSLGMHHVVVDGWSLDVLFRELEALYGAFARGEPSPLAPLPVQYADFAAWQRGWLAGETLERQLAFWSERLREAPPVLDLPTDRPRPQAPSGRRATREAVLPATLAAGLRALARREGATLFMTTLAGFQALLGRYAGQDDVLVGTPAAGRDRVELEGLVGFFVNTLVLRADLSGDPDGRALLAQARERTLEAQAHADLPFERLVDALGVERSLSHTPLFQVMFSLVASRGRERLRLEGVETETVRVTEGETPFDLSLVVVEQGDRLLAAVDFQAELFDPATVERMTGHLRVLLEGMAARPDLPVSALPLLPAAERARVVEEWNATERPYPRGESVHRLVARQASLTPGAPAVLWEAGTLTFAELEARAGRLARVLVRHGVGPEARVGICLDRSPEMLAAVLAVLGAGGAYVPLDPEYPAERLEHMLGDSGARVVVTRRELAGALPASAHDVVLVDDLEEEGTDAAPDVAVHPESAAYVIYTSGSTGTPRGVLVPHRALVAHATAAREEYGIGPADRVLQFASLSFDASVEEIYPALLGGAALVLRTTEMLASAAAFLAAVAERGVTLLDLPTAFWHELVAELERGEAEVPACVRLVIIGGERALPERVAAWHARVGPSVRLVNTYGPTEATVVATAAELEAGAPVTIGAPVPNARAYVLDARLAPVPVGVRGELYLGGAGVARGYLGRPDTTAERFLPDPFAAEAGARMYRSGDVARWRAEGRLEFVGRADAQVKVRGFRVEPAEVEGVLLRHRAVRDAAVMAREDEPGRVRLVGYVVAEGEEAPTVAELRAWVKASLPEHMVPSAWVALDALPLTPSGKTDLRALPAPDAARAGDGYVAPRTQAEETVAGIWAAVLGLERVGAHDDFFALGGHSLLATRVVSRLRQAFGVDLPLRALFESPTVAGVAAALRGAQGTAAPPIGRADRSAPLPLSFAQERLWFLDHLEPGSSLYLMPMAVRLRGPLDAAALEWSLGETVRRHEALRTVFAVRGGRAVQVVLPPGDTELPLDDLAGAPAGAVREAVGAEAWRPFDLERGPLLRARLLRLGAEEHVLVVSMHHVVADAWSTGIFFRELSALYAARLRGEASPLAPLPVQYADYAVWQRGWLSGEVLERQLAWWRERLRGAPPVLELPTDRPRPAVQRFRGDLHRFAVPEETVRPLRALARREGATLYMALLAAWQLLLARWSGQDDVVVGTPVAGRTTEEVEGLVGLFVNTLALRAELWDDPSFRALLARVRESVLGALAHQEVPFEKLVEELQPERSLSHAPVFQVMFSFQNAGGGGLRLPGVALEPVELELRTEKFDLTLTMWEEGEGVEAALQYATDLFDAATLERMARHLAALLAGVGADPERAVSDVPLLDAAERRALLAAAGTGGRLDADATLHALFTEAAARDPHAVAVRLDGESLSYGELEAHADRLARGLRRRGVGPETRVALCAERSVELVVAVLGILKAGGAYVPVDPAYPAERIAYLLEDSGCALVLSQDELRPLLPETGVPVLSLDEASEEGGDVDLPEVLPGNAAYVIYTSGSTGRPKGVVVTHANVVRLFRATEQRFGFGEEDVWTLFHSYAFDFSVWEIWGALLYGGRLVVVPFATSRDPEAFRALLARERVTVLSQTPSAFRQLVRADEAAGAAAPLALRWVVFGGEALEPRTLLPWLARHGDGAPRLVNMYGITETTVHVTFRPVTLADAEAGRGSAIGEPLPDLRVYVLDRRAEPVPPGVPGEMHVGGAGVARGYLGRPDLTAERFVPDPFSGEPGARLYRSGDRARRRADGELEYLGRADSQVKVRGFRIEPGEIESALLAHTGVREALVLAREDVPGEKRLAAYLVADGPVPLADLRAHLAERLPEHMVPAAFVLLDAFPLTPHGKTDRRALPAPDGARPDEGAGYVAPRTEVEAALAEVWAESLGVERVGVDDNYFALGGDSIRSIQLLARARERGIGFDLTDLFRHQTVAELAREVRGHRAEDGAGREPFALLSEADRALVPEGIEDAYPMTRLQLGMVYHTEENPREATYQNVHSFRLRAPFDEARLRAALRAVAERHSVLRTSFDLARFSEPVQRVHREASFPLVVRDVSRLDRAEQDRAVDEWMTAERTRRFDWSAPPLIRCHAHLRAADEWELGFTEHHSILDGWSVASFLAELFALLFAPAGEAAPVAAPPAAVFRDFVALEREALASPAARDFWARQVEDAVPTVPPSLAEGGSTGSRVAVGTLDGEAAEGVHRFARRAGVPLRTALLAAHLAVLAAEAGTDDVVTGLVSNGRPEGTDGERVLGLFLNTLPFRHRMRGGSWEELARSVFETERSILPFRRFPVAEIQRMRGGEPLFEATFNYVHFHVLDRVAASEGGRFLESRGSGSTSFPLAVSFESGTGSAAVQLFVEHDTARFSAEQAERLVARYLAALRRMAADPASPVAADLPSDAAGEASSGWSDTGRDWPFVPVHEAFAEQAARTPDAVAVSLGTEALTYAELERRSAGLAAALRARGVGPESRVGVCFARSPEMVVAVLAVLRAGAAYVPLDPAYPAERLRWVAEDAGVALALTHAAAAGSVPEGVEAVRVEAGSGAPGSTPLPQPLPHKGGGEHDYDTTEGEDRSVEMALPQDWGRVASPSAPTDASSVSPEHDVVLPSPLVGEGSGVGGTTVSADTLAYVIYTSGSTGRPKGVAVPHGALANHMRWMQEELPLAADDRVLQRTSLGFDASVWEVLAPLLAGARLVLAPPDAQRDPALLLRVLSGEGVTVAQFVPSLLAVLLDEPGWEGCGPLRRVFCGGEALPAGVAARVRERTGAEVVNLYGPTETCIDATWHRFAEGGAGAVVPIGLPVANTRAHVLGEGMRAAPAGVPGELYLGGAQLARGYLGRPDLTAERFVPDPFSGAPGARLYRTGDRVRRLAGGALEYLGRTDHQVKVRGFRVEPGEVESVLREHPAVRDAAVVVREASLAAYLVPAPGAEIPPAAELRGWARERLPEHMVPAALVVLDALPLTASGKLDRRALPAPHLAADEEAYAAPRTPTEERLAGIWGAVLGVERVGVRDDFFDLGGHSLLATQVASRVREAFRVELLVADLFQHLTVEELARRVDELVASGSRVAGGRIGGLLVRRGGW